MSVGWPGCGEADTQRAHSCIPLGLPGKRGGSLLSVSAFWYSPGSGFLDSLAPGKHRNPGRDCCWLSGKARVVEIVYEGVGWASKVIIVNLGVNKACGGWEPGGDS